MTTLLRASDSAEFLGLVPALAGFTPTQSLVLLPFHGTRAHGAMRLDLPGDDVSPDDYADAAIGLIAKVEGADAVAVVVYCDDDPCPTPDGLVLPLIIQIDELLGCAEEAGLRIVDALCVTPSGWSSYLEDDPELAPLPAADPLAVDQHAGAELPTADLVEKEHVGRALSDIRALLDREEHAHLDGSENPLAIAALVMLEDIPEFFETLLESPDHQPPFATAALLWCLDRPLLRDVALVQWATSLADGVRTLEAQYEFAEAGTRAPDDLGSIFLGRGPSPDVDRLQTALTVVRLAAARAPRDSRPAPLTIAAWLSWALGRATHAEHYLRLVREIDPAYGLAELLGTVVGAGMLPEWAFRRGPRGAGRAT
jgi:hypothetical protein